MSRAKPEINWDTILPSELLEVALLDLETCERSPGYEINMGIWHEYNAVSEQCYVCLAGAVMAQSMNVDKCAYYSSPSQYKLHGINLLRVGDIDRACNCFDIELPDGMPASVSVTHYDEDSNQFKNDMRNLIVLLKQYGI